MELYFALPSRGLALVEVASVMTGLELEFFHTSGVLSFGRLIVFVVLVFPEIWAPFLFPRAD